MASAAGRKKSIVSTAGLQIETPVANNTLLNKSASQSTSLYQQCSSLRSRLTRIHDFSKFFQLAAAADARESTDPVTQLWDLFSLGIPLCYIFNLLPSPNTPININTNTEEFDVNDDRAKKRAIALFAMQIRQVSQCEPFTVTDLWDRNSTDGLVKVINTVTTIVDMLPEESFEAAPPSPPTLSTHESTDSLGESLASSPANAQETARNNIIREIVETERKYVQDLEVMQKYSNALSQNNILAQDEIHYLFPNLNKLLNFQRKFLIRLESTAELPWQDQRWGLHFIQSEEEFVVYEPYCANYTSAQELMLANEQNLMNLNGLINVKSELPAFLIKPVQRICKYPLLLDSLIKASKLEEYPHYEELKAGSAAAKRITDKINEAQRRAENEQTVKDLEGRIEDWKGHHLSHFGELVLDEIFLVKKSGVDREYHVFLFEKIILCCKEAPMVNANGKKVTKSNSILKKPPSGPLGGPSPRKNTPLLLKGRIFLNNVTKAAPMSSRSSTGSPPASPYALDVWWRGDDDLEFFTLRCRTEEQLKLWEGQINRLIKEAAQRRATERNLKGAAMQANSGVLGRHMTLTHDRTMSSGSTAGSLAPLLPPSMLNGQYDVHELSPGLAYTGQQAYSPYVNFDEEEDYEDYPPSFPPSGRGTPMGGARRTNAMSMPADRDAFLGYERSREDLAAAQWRGNGLPGPGGPGLRPMAPRMNSNASLSSFTSDASYAGRPPSSQSHYNRPLRNQPSSTKLRPAQEPSDGRGNAQPPKPPSSSGAPPPVNRARSASQPSAYNGNKHPHPPMPNASWVGGGPPQTMSSNPKRGSGSSQSTGGSSEYSPNSSSPITPFGSSESSLAGGSRAPRAQQGYDSGVQGPSGQMQWSPPVKVKVHYHEDIFVIQVARATVFEELVDKVGKKIRLCGPRREDGPLRVRYRDEDGDMISLGSTEDVQMAFESYRPGGQVTLFVT